MECVNGIKFETEKDENIIIHLVRDIAPSADAQPVRHGRWNCGDDMFEYAVCSYCKWDSGEAWEYAKKYFKYCPNCGAKMDGEQNETD